MRYEDLVKNLSPEQVALVEKMDASAEDMQEIASSPKLIAARTAFLDLERKKREEKTNV